MKTAENRYRDFENGAPSRGAEGDQDGMPVKEVHVRFNTWEHARLQQLARKDCTSLQRAIRMIVRRHLLGD